MGVNLQKGQRISLNKEAGGALSRVTMGLGWDVAKGGFLGFGGGRVDLDASCILFDAAGRRVDVVWFRQLKSRDGSVRHSGDNLTGGGDGDDERIGVTLDAVPATVTSLVFTVNSFSGQDFSRIGNAFCRLVDDASGAEIARFNLSAQGTHTAQIMAKLYRHDGEWKLHAIGENANGRTFDALIPLIVPHL